MSSEKPKLGNLISADNPPDGSSPLELGSPDGSTQTIMGRDVTREYPSTSDHACGCPGMRTIRYPTTGLNLPDEDRPVGILLWCDTHGETGAGMDTATEQERGWGWHTPTIV